MMGRSIQMRRLIQIIALVVLGIFWGASDEAGAANEQRCTELGANCVCSEPLNTATYTSPTNAFYNPTDTIPGVDKECLRATGFPGTVLEDSTFRYVSQSGGEMFTALPFLSPKINYILRTKTTAEGNAGGGGQFVGTQYTASNPSARRAFRYYLYWSPTYEFYTNPTCVNSVKIMQFGHNSTLSFIFEPAGSYFATGAWIGWSFGAFSGMDQGPGDPANAGLGTPSYLRGYWFRIEAVTTNNNASDPAPFTFKVYMKNVTLNTPEQLIIDSTVPTAQRGTPASSFPPWSSTMATTMHPTSGDNMDQMYINLFRRDTCSGYKGMSHLLFAAWSTDAGQRINAATEIEGGSGGDTTAPVSPANLRVSRLTQ